MKAYTTIACITLSLSFSVHSMDIDLFSQLPNKVRKKIIFPLFKHKTLRQASDILGTMSCISKKSYEQTNCIFFTTDVVNFLAKKHNIKNSLVALNIMTAGADKYITLGNELHEIINELPSITINKKKYKNLNYENRIALLRYCLNQGADAGYQSLHFGVTPLANAISRNDTHIVEFLIKWLSCHGADTNKKLIIEHYKRIITGHLVAIIHSIKVLLQSGLPEQTIYEILDNNSSIDAIRTALSNIPAKEGKRIIITMCARLPVNNATRDTIMSIILDRQNRQFPLLLSSYDKIWNTK